MQINPVGRLTAMSVFAIIALASSLAMAGGPRYLTHEEVCNRIGKAPKPKTCELCKDGGLQKLDHAISELKKVDGWIEAVPPSEAEYLEREASLNSSAERHNMAMKNAYYPAWVLRREIKEAMGLVGKLSSSDMSAMPTALSPQIPTDRNRKLAKLFIAERVTAKLGDVRVAFSHYARRDRARNPSVLTPRQWEIGDFSPIFASLSISFYAECVVADLQDYAPE